MLVSATSDMVRAVRLLIRRADTELVRGAARNAATGVAQRQLSGQEADRVLAELGRVQPARRRLPRAE
jgi:hypothetical protein